MIVNTVDPVAMKKKAAEEKKAKEKAAAEEKKKSDGIAAFRTAAKKSIDEWSEKSELAREAATDDRAVERFLIAREYDITKSVTMWLDAVKWRDTMKLDTCLDNPYPDGLEIRKLLDNQSEHGFDKFGRPVYIEYIGRLDISRLHGKFNLDQMLQYQFHTTEFRRKFLFPRGSAIAGKRIDQVCSILDLKGLATRHLAKDCYSFLKALSHLSQNNYPELLGQLFVVNAPTLFAVAWKIIGPWLNERTRKKIQIFSGNGKAELLKVIDAKTLPVALGGECTCDGHTAGCLEGHEMNQLYIKVAKYGKDWETDGKKPEAPKASENKDSKDIKDAPSQSVSESQQQPSTSTNQSQSASSQQQPVQSSSTNASNNSNNQANGVPGGPVIHFAQNDDSLSNEELARANASSNVSQAEAEAAMKNLTVNDGAS